jgi:hypothetical protein
MQTGLHICDGNMSRRRPPQSHGAKEFGRHCAAIIGQQLRLLGTSRRIAVEQPTMGRSASDEEQFALAQPDAGQAEKGLPSEAAAIRFRRHRRWSALALVALLCLAFHLVFVSESAARYHYQYHHRGRVQPDWVSRSELRDWVRRMPQSKVEKIFLSVPSNDSASDALKR